MIEFPCLLGFYGTGLMFDYAWIWWQKRRARKSVHQWACMFGRTNIKIDDLLLDKDHVAFLLQELRTLARENGEL